jgi:formate-dependent nitrite reductase membrane component NrfD
MAQGYYGQPLLKPPVWTWEVPVYFFVGGAAGIAAVIGAIGGLAGADASLVRDARVVAAAGALVSPALLVADLGRPARFLNMLRVFKTQSAMSMGAWTLAVFTPAVLAALLWGPGAGGAGASVPVRILGHAASLAGAATGLVLVTYTGVLIGVTAIPVWAAHARTLPWNFAASSLGAAVSILEIAGHHARVMNVLGIASAAGLVAMWVLDEIDRRPASRPLTAGPSGRLIRVGKLLSGLLPLVLRILWPASVPLRLAAAVCTIAGAVLSRFAWMAAARASVLLAALALVLAPTVAAQQPGPIDLSTKALVAAATGYVADYEERFKFLLADEDYTQRVYNASGRLQRERHLKGELFLTFIPGDSEWIAVHDFAQVDGAPVPNREDLRAVLQKGDVTGTAARIAQRNARFNIGRLGRNFNEPTLALLLLDPKRVKNVDFQRGDVVTVGDRKRVTLRFQEDGRPTLIRDAVTGQSIYAKGSLTIDGATGRVERTEFELISNHTTSQLVTDYEPDEKLGLWVPVLFRERYDDARDRDREVIQCEARYTNFRRFEVTGRIKLP